MKGIQYGKSYGSLDDTVILIEADESTPLLVDRRWSASDGNNNESAKEKSLRGHGGSTWSFASSSGLSSSPSNYSGNSTKSFKSHFWELKVLAFAMMLLAAISVAVYLLVIESRFPAITFSLDLVHHDVWSQQTLFRGEQLNPRKVDSVIVTQTGSQNCDNSEQCVKVLQQMQEDYSRHKELPYNFVIGGDAEVYEVRGWGFESDMPGVKKSHSLVIGIMGNFESSPPSQELLKATNFLILESAKRHKLRRPYRVYGLHKLCSDCQDDDDGMFEKIMKWPKFRKYPVKY